MGYKMIAVDMDGTLLNDAGQITPVTAAAIVRAMAAGVVFSISTGRPIQGIEKYNHILHLNAPVIAYNGAMVVDPQTKQVLFQQGLEKDDARRILALGNALGTTMCIWSANRLYGNVLNDKIHDYKKLSGVEPLLVEDYEALLEQGITKILWYDTVEKLAKYQQMLGEMAFDSVTYCTSKPVFLEFFNSKVSKAKAMEFIGGLYQIRREEMIAIGDGLNDLSMIEYAGLGVAMGNAHPAVKEIAGYVTASNEEDGIAQVIQEFIRL